MSDLDRLDHRFTPERLALKEAGAEFTRREIAPHLQQWEDDGILRASCTRLRQRRDCWPSGIPRRPAVRGETCSTSAPAGGFMAEGASGGLIASLFTHASRSRT